MGACRYLIVELLVLAEDKGADPIKHPAQLEVGEGALQRLGRFQAVLQQQNVAVLDDGHIGEPQIPAMVLRLPPISRPTTRPEPTEISRLGLHCLARVWFSQSSRSSLHFAGVGNVQGTPASSANAICKKLASVSSTSGGNSPKEATSAGP